MRALKHLALSFAFLLAFAAGIPAQELQTARPADVTPVALITLDMEECEKLAEERGWPADPAQLRRNEGMRALIQEHLDKVNEKFARVEQVKKFEILPHDLSQETGELTPTLKVKRNVVADKFEKDVDALYA